MKPKPLLKPPWLLYAEEARKRLDNIKPNKSGKREERLIYDTWLTAKSEKGYEGSDRDWEFILRRLGRRGPRREP